MAEGKNGDGPLVRVTVRIMVPEVNLEEVSQLTIIIEGIVQNMEGATYDLSISSPRPERPR